MVSSSQHNYPIHGLPATGYVEGCPRSRGVALRRNAEHEIRVNLIPWPRLLAFGGILHFRRTSKLIRASCCFHIEDTPSLTFWESSNGFTCFGCQTHGDKYRWVCVRLLDQEPCSWDSYEVDPEAFERVLTWIETGSPPSSYVDWVPEQLELFPCFDDMPF